MPRLSRIVGHAALFAAAVTVAEAQQEAAERVGDLAGLVLMHGSLLQTRESCIDLFPSQAEVIRGFYQASSAPSYSWLPAQRVLPSTGPDREKTLQSLGQSEEEASAWCLTDFPEMLNEFDTRYENRSDDLKAQFERLEEYAATRLPVARTPPPPPRNERHRELFATIVERGNRGYETGDWSAFADLYEPNTFDCWATVPDSRQFGFLSMPPISSSASVSVTTFDYGVDPNSYAFTTVQPTHLMSISDRRSSPGGRCGLDALETWPRYDFFLVQRGEEFALTHFCPVKGTASGMPVASRRALSASQTATNVSQLSQEDWDAIAQEVRRDRYSGRSHEYLRTKFGLHYEEATAVIEHVCNPANVP